MRHPLYIGLWLTLLLASPPWLWAQETGQVRVSGLNMRAGPGPDYPILEQLPRGSMVTVDGNRDGWLQITHGKTRGFILNDTRFVMIQPAPPAAEPAADEKKVKTMQETAETLQRQLLTSKNELTTMAAEEKRVLNEFDELDHRLNRTRDQIRRIQAAKAEVDEKASQLQHQYKDLEQKIQDQEAYTAQRLVALYKLNWLGRVHLLASASSFFDFIQRKSSLERILESDRMSLDELQSSQSALDTLLEQLNVSMAEKRSLELTLQKEASDLAARQQQRQAMLDRIHSEKALQLAAVQNLEQAAEQLNLALNPDVAPGPLTKPEPEADPGPEPSFENLKGLLTWPVQGKIISFFGSQTSGRFNVRTFQSGIDIEAERGEPVKAVAGGYTVFSNWFNGFGNIIIIDHGHHFYTVYAHLEESFKVKGDRVEKGEVIATVGDSGALQGPALHFEVRHHGSPADPLLWIKKRLTRGE